ncbi:MAG: DUF3088 family protein [Brevundimonas sp.]|uniref:DUF3088 family protein n=1 Tax=Brevundimonas sp. TaxID=1871086 RepID=UPI002604FD46|nr:DUF3088 family protein [Brevundimonas sp.]MDI6625069.1 DUF3088 family protein [Brevundimonas sp.]MDQ7813316.1 DUF3088 family protein [Brevundimonas sp.]
MTDRLFVLNPDWTDDEGGPWFCPAGAFVEGVLAFYPALKSHLDITRLDHPRPRLPVIALVGEDHQSCPILILDGEFDWPAADHRKHRPPLPPGSRHHPLSRRPIRRRPAASVRQSVRLTRTA